MKDIHCLVNIKDFSAGLIASSGQCFRMKTLEDDEIYTVYRVTAGQKYIDFAQYKQNNGFTLEFYCSMKEYERDWKNYFDAAFDVEKVRAQIPADDDFLKSAFEKYKGLRILRQNKLEMLITFIISQRKSIPAISSCVEQLCEKYGEEIEDGVFGFPAPDRLSSMTESDWESLGTGYRAPYLVCASRYATEHNLDELDQLTTPELIKELMTISGVGIKVASCVALFGYHRLDAAPVDVWIKRVIDNHYSGISPFPGYGENAGLFQQYMFCMERENKTVENGENK